MTAPRPSYRRPCGWQALLPPRRQMPPLRGTVAADVAVIGAGYTGLAAARTWAELRPCDRVVVLEADAVGDGSPGRNSGFMLEITLADDADPAAVERLNRCNGLIGETTLRVGYQTAGQRLQVAVHKLECRSGA